MSSSVSPRRRRYRGSGSSEPKGLTHSREAAFLRTCQSGNVDSCRTPPPAAPPLSALCARQRRTLLHRINCTQTSQRVCLTSPTFQPSTLNRLIPTCRKMPCKKQTKHLICGISDASSSLCTPVGSRTPIVGTGIRNSIH